MKVQIIVNLDIDETEKEKVLDVIENMHYEFYHTKIIYTEHRERQEHVQA